MVQTLQGSACIFTAMTSFLQLILQAKHGMGAAKSTFFYFYFLFLKAMKRDEKGSNHDI